MIHVHDGGKTVAENSSAVYRLLVLQRLESQNEVEFALPVIRYMTVKLDKYAAAYAEKRRAKLGKKEEA